MVVPQRRIFRSSHARFVTPGGRAVGIGASHRDIRLRWTRSLEVKRQLQGMSFGPPEAPLNAKEIDIPQPGVFRAVASMAARTPRSSKYIANFERVLHTYANLQLGYRHRHTLEEFLLAHLNKEASDWRRRVVARSGEIWRKYMRDPARRKEAMSELVTNLSRCDLENMIERFIGKIEDEVMNMAKSGRVVDRPTRVGYKAVRSEIGSRTCFLILNGPKERHDLKILALMQSGKFDQSTKNRLRGRQRYSNRPPSLRY